MSRELEARVNSGLPDTIESLCFFRLRALADGLELAAESATSTSDEHSEVVPPLPIPNRAVKRLSADDSVVYSMRK